MKILIAKQIFFFLVKYSFITLSLFTVPIQFLFLSIPRYLYVLPSLIGLILRLFIVHFKVFRFFGNFPFSTCWYAYLSSPNAVLVPLENVVTMSFFFFDMLILLVYNFRLSTKNCELYNWFFRFRLSTL